MTLWRFKYTDQRGKRRETSYLLTEDEAREAYGDSVEKVESSRTEVEPLEQLPTPIGSKP